MCHCIINFSKYIALNTFLIYYTKNPNIVPPELINLFERNIVKEISNILNVLKITAISTMPASDFKDINLKAIESFEQYFQ